MCVIKMTQAWHRGIKHSSFQREQVVALQFATVNHLVNEQQAGKQNLHSTGVSTLYTNRHLGCFVWLCLVPLGGWSHFLWGVVQFSSEVCL